MKFTSAMLRERFSIQNSAPVEDGGKPINITALSTRMTLDLQAGNLPKESFVVRAHNMHSCARICGKILHDYDKRGPILSREPSLKIHELWEDSISHYETAYNKPWVCIYHNGKPYFSMGEHHPFLDVIEKCDILNKAKGDYDSSIRLAQNALRQAGAEAKIFYHNNVALSANLDRSNSRCGMILRNPDRTNNFKVSINETSSSGKMNIALGLFMGAAFLEGVQLAYFIGLQQAKLRKGIIKRYSADDKRTREARERLAQIEAEINASENRYTVRYRPERPIFLEIIQTSDRVARRKTLPEEQGIDSNTTSS